MSKPKDQQPDNANDDLKVFTITETFYCAYQVVARSEDEALDHYRNMPVEEWKEMVLDGASNNYCDEEISDEEDFDPDEHNGIPKANPSK